MKVSMVSKIQSIFLCAYILEWVDALGALLNLTANHLWDELLGELAERADLSLTLHNIRHLLPNLPNLRQIGRAHV